MAGKKHGKASKKDGKSKDKKKKADKAKAGKSKSAPMSRMKSKPASKSKAKPAPKAAAAKRAPGVPPGKRSITPYLVIEGAARAIDFYKDVFGAEEHMRMGGPGEKVMHAEIQIGDSLIMIADDFPEMCGGQSRSPVRIGNTPVTIHLYVAEVDDVFNRAVGAGCDVVMPPADMFWGDRFSCVKDPFGHMWSIATFQKEMTPEEIGAAAAAAFAGGGCGPEHGAMGDATQSN